MKNVQKEIDKKTKRTVLVTDSEAGSREILGKILSKEFNVIYAENGERALDVLRVNRNAVSLLVLDVTMPMINGKQILEIISGDKELGMIPVIALASKRNIEAKSLELGAVDFISKPYDFPEGVLARVRRSIRLNEYRMIVNATQFDAVTGLYKREFFIQFCKDYDIKNPDSERDVIVLNVNRLFIINEVRGRSVGDDILRLIGTKILHKTFSLNGIACRTNGDYFYLYVDSFDDYKGFLKEISDYVNDVVKTFKIYIRMGVYKKVDKSVSIESRVDRAKIAANYVKSEFSSEYLVYDAELHNKEMIKVGLVSDIDRALAEKQFKILFQPKFNIRGKEEKLCGAEALVRWQHPERGLISPAVFIPVFEEHALIQKLDRYVWGEVAAKIKEWKETFGVTLPISVNVSRLDLLEPDVEDFLLGLLDKNGLSAGDMVLEITETAYTVDSELIISKICDLREHGFFIEMDDFGSGYSSLNMLTNLPIDALKLDMAFIKNMVINSKDGKMVKLIIEISDLLDIPVIAEGVENKEQLNLLKKYCCEIVQGYYFSKPVPDAEIEKFIINYKKKQKVFHY